MAGQWNDEEGHTVQSRASLSVVWLQLLGKLLVEGLSGTLPFFS